MYVIVTKLRDTEVKPAEAVCHPGGNESAEQTQCDEQGVLRVGCPLASILSLPVSLRELKACFELLNTDKSCRAIVLTGSGKAFTAGKFCRISLLVLNHDTSRNRCKIPIHDCRRGTERHRRCSPQGDAPSTHDPTHTIIATSGRQGKSDLKNLRRQLHLPV